MSLLRWLLPAGLLVIALFLQNLGQYAGTRGYVRWMDILNHPEVRDNGEAIRKRPIVEAALVDRAAMAFGAGEVNTDFLCMLTSLLPLVWLAFILHQKDLRLWAHTLLTAAALAVLKGFLASSTIIPDAAGWTSCRNRLGDDGLNYYRQEMTGFLPFEAFIDILFLELRGLAAPGFAARGGYCTSGFISTPIYVSAIFSLAICELALRATRQVPSRQRVLVRAVIWGILALLVTLNGILPIIGQQHYTADVVVSLVLSMLLYSSPAIALVAERWSQVPAHIPPSSSLAHEVIIGAGLGDIVGLREEPEDDVKVVDVGQVMAVPCGPWCWEPIYYLRSQPGRLGHPGQEHHQDGSMELQLQEQMAQFEALEEEYLQSRQEKEDQLQAEREKARKRAIEAAKAEEWQFKGKLAEETQRLEAEERKTLEATRQRLIAEREPIAEGDCAARKSVDLSVLAMKNERRKASEAAEAKSQEECARLEEQTRQAQQDLEDTTRACERQDAEIAEMQRKVQEVLAARDPAIATIDWQGGKGKLEVDS
jgi:hypothetical protein